MNEAGPILEAADYRDIFEAAPDGYLVVDAADGRIREVNRQACQMFGYPRRELLGALVEMLVPEALRSRHERDRAKYARGPVARPMGIGLELTGARKDGALFPVEISLSPIDTEDGRAVIAVVRDISERARMRAFGTGMLQGAEEERRRIARELHDDTAQTLAALLMRLQMARRTSDVDRREELLGAMHGEILRASDSVYRILRGLRPPALEESGLVAAVRAHIREAVSPTGLSVDLQADAVDDALSPEARLAMYRIIQEALSNAVRHANARTVEVRIHRSEEAVSATIADDGAGFDLEAVRRGGGVGLGLLGMQERAKVLDGTVTIETAPERGVRVSVDIPRSQDTP